LAKSERAVLLNQRFEKVLESIGEFEKKLFDEWSAEVTEISQENLQQPLLIRKLNKELALNFHPQVFKNNPFQRRHKLKVKNSLAGERFARSSLL